MEKILVIGANGQIGSELVAALALQYGTANVVAADITPRSLYGAALYEVIDVLDPARLAAVVEQYHITEVYQLAALLSATGEKAPLKAWELNMDGLLNILELARLRGAAGKPLKIFWPSSIAAFGPNTPAINTPQYTVMDPSTIYGISKLAGERLCEYYFDKYGVDVRSIRYPGIISYKSPPGGGTTDYAIAIFHAALRGETYSCFLTADTTLPMIYMPDAIRATISLMQADASKLTVRSAYNVAGLSFNPHQLAAAIKQNLPKFDIDYQPDSRQAIAASWPQSLDDQQAGQDWGWHAQIDLNQLVSDMLKHVQPSQPELSQAA
ncbi:MULTISPECIES: NAD-dependent epimerase/dehydratase family protein [unclassified Undibacterium]|uniref:NAD-dependent epimerase/dehydratase family protein n=1 Tax=unclassified Undibacterium TaxID=2630295 RepID=UPI002AC8FE16|nr:MULTISPECIES: NAD-dependent epimerase/dehydratase family protein [unclassified Undibacterium]MEB0138292.1 NAD-dependent epimerase/dehydratase family protein [Undibacterium sp. CCC2.1]MEB0170778.1 NAD-dependent epimerase/dehydratase family protein [Undibacterium sp. CCC1.1]MEB0174667.1 NAD-dependent epimerase/dehydratase family protein [Undibacterium sp. CCC3.4]MEB0213864.1 NAD-dependent epimerase/dehydratase family protein [Undibacterium sp. 5I2]WPX42590.1 NAD-dependent epimerase/dehydratas